MKLPGLLCTQSSTRPVVICLLTVSFVILLLSCTGEAPEINQVFWQLNVLLDRSIEQEYERLSLFLHVEDADGFDDLSTIYLLHDRNELQWKIESEDWELFEENSEKWIGLNTLYMPNWEAFPRGKYRVIVVDRAGDSGRDELFLSTDRFILSEIRFPRAELRDEIIVLRSSYKEHTLWLYDGQNKVSKTFTTDSKRMPLSSILRQRDLAESEHLFLYTYDDTRGIGLISGPYDLRSP